MTISDHVSSNPVIGLIIMAVMQVINFVLHIMGKYHNIELPAWFMQAGQIIFWCIGGCVGLITIFEWLKKNINWFKKRFKK